MSAPLKVMGAAMIALASCSPCEPRSVQYAGGDGSTPAAAIQIGGLTDRCQSYWAETDYMLKRYPGFKQQSFVTVWRSQRMYDAIRITHQNEPRTLYFDVTDRYVQP